jgi:hypothetical protein
LVWELASVRVLEREQVLEQVLEREQEQERELP